MSHAAPASQSTQSPAAQQQSPPQQQLPASAAGASKPKQSTTGWVTSLWRSYGNKYIIPTIKYIVALAFTIAAFVYVPKGYKAAIQSYKATNLSNELSQKESCRAHPNNPILQATDLCRQMHEAGDYDRLSKRALKASIKSAHQVLTSTGAVWKELALLLFVVASNAGGMVSDRVALSMQLLVILAVFSHTLLTTKGSKQEIHSPSWRYVVFIWALSGYSWLRGRRKKERLWHPWLPMFLVRCMGYSLIAQACFNAQSISKDMVAQVWTLLCIAVAADAVYARKQEPKPRDPF